MSSPTEGRPSIFQRLPLPIALLIGFILLPFGVVLLPLVPEIAIPTLLLSTRLLGRRFEWARRFNGWVDQKWQAVRTRLKGDPASARPALWRWIVGAIVIVLLWQIVGSIMTVFTVISAGLTLEEFLPSGGFGATPVAPDRAALILFAILLSFVPFFLGNLIAYRYILKASVVRLFTQTGRFSLRRVMFGFGLWLILGLVGVFFIELANPGVVQWVFDPVGALPYVLVALLLIPIQTTAEELFFRGWILQWSDNGKRRRSDPHCGLRCRGLRLGMGDTARSHPGACHRCACGEQHLRGTSCRLRRIGDPISLALDDGAHPSSAGDSVRGAWRCSVRVDHGALRQKRIRSTHLGLHA
jgi:hypothetical protein